MNIRISVLLATILFGFMLSACGGGGGDAPSAPPVNRLPQAVIGSITTTGYAPLLVELDGSSSSDSDGSIATYTWHMGDGNSYAGSTISHTYTTLGSFSVTLTVTDDDGASSSTDISIDVYAQAAGYYVGILYSDITQSFTEVEVIVGANHEIRAWDWNNYRSSYWGSFDINADQIVGTLDAEVWDLEFVFPDGSTKGIVDLVAVVDPRHSITGSYVGVGDSGTIDLNYLPALAERPSSLAEVSGNWGYTDGLYTETLIVGESGLLDYSDTDGCTGTGQMDVLDPTLNGFEVQWNWNCPNLTPQWVGPSSGLVFIDDYYSPGEHWIVFAESKPDGTASDVWSTGRPSP